MIKTKKQLVQDHIALNIQSVLALEKGVYRIRRVEKQLIKKNDFIRIDGVIYRFSQTKTGFGSRSWFQCPLCKCNTANLYFTNVTACRRCCNLTYQTQNWTPNQNKGMRLKKRIFELQDKLQVTDDNCMYVLPLIKSELWRAPIFKPRYMHQKTFDWLRGDLLFRQSELHRLFNEQYPFPD